MILSGGLGSSAYVRDRLQEDLSLNPHPNAAHIKIVQAHDPQLVVVKGLILDRLQKLETGDKPVLATRKARASYGVMCKMKYNPQIHFQEELKTDPLDGQVYAMSQIDWLIRKVCSRREKAKTLGIDLADSACTLTGRRHRSKPSNNINL